MWEYIKNWISQNPKSILFDKNTIISYDELMQTAEKNGNHLKKSLPAKTKCAVLCDKGINAAVSVLSCWYAGMVPVPMSKNYGQKHCQNIIDLVEPAAILYDNTIDITCTSLTAEDCLNDVAVIMCTSGTTGTPKGAMITEQGLIKNMENISKYFNLQKDDKIIIARPLYHCAVLTGELLVSLYKGLNIGFFDEVYNPASVIDYINRHEITVICGTPTLLNHISMYLKRKPCETHIKKIAVSGECLTRTIARNIRSVFPETEIYSVYGLTEAAPRVSCLPPEHFDAYPESVGIPLNDTIIKIADAQNREKELQSNTHGKIMVTSPSIMKGYYRNEDLTAAVVTDGWLDTGDIGYKDENGFLYIASREDDMIIKAGMNIYPGEIENVINELPVIESSVAYGVNGNIAINVVLNKGYDNIGVKELMKIFGNALPSYQMPSAVNITEQIERNASGKIIRRRTGT